jgi:NAD+ synthase (glutamine-hydrolysing)
MRIVLAQIDTVVGDVDGNLALVERTAHEAARLGAEVVVFPEMVITGYPPMDLLERPELIERSADAVSRLAGTSRQGPDLVVGHPSGNTAAEGRPFVNAVSLLSGGRVAATIHKRLLPSYDVFDEDRWFEPGREAGTMSAGSTTFGVAVCEDAWRDGPAPALRRYPVDPVAEAVEAGARVILNPSASPYERGKPHLRERLLSDLARRHARPVLMVNQVGGNDSLVFDGGSLAVDGAGRTVARAPLFEPYLLVVDLEDGEPHAQCVEWPTGDEEVLGALKLGVRDYVHKCGFESVVLGLSGGIDSAVVATLACDTLGPDRVMALSMPSRFSSPGSVRDARTLADNLDMRLEEVSIERPFEALLATLGPLFEGRPFDVTEENLQARIRGTLLMSVANKLGKLVLATGNKSELAVGYSTLYGDMVGALAPIGDVLKTDVFALARALNRQAERIPRVILEKPPSAELRPGQLDEDTLPPYSRLDEVLRMYLEQDMHVESIVEAGVDEALVARILDMVRNAEYKRIQAALTLKISPRAFGAGRRYPVAQGFAK